MCYHVHVVQDVRERERERERSTRAKTPLMQDRGGGK
jgi:hypothetical protein